MAFGLGGVGFASEALRWESHRLQAASHKSLSEQHLRDLITGVDFVGASLAGQAPTKTEPNCFLVGGCLLPPTKTDLSSTFEV